jgi:hypothetical protein
MNKTETTYIKNLNANDRFTFPGIDTILVCERRFHEKPSTLVDYRVAGTDIRATVIKPGLSTVHRLV